MRTETEAHLGQHQDCQPCFAIKLASIQLQGPASGDRRKVEKSRNRDMNEYPVLRKQGYQPRNVFGCAEVAAQAGSVFEVEHSVVMAPDIRKEMNKKLEIGKEIAEGKA